MINLTNVSKEDLEKACLTKCEECIDLQLKIDKLEATIAKVINELGEFIDYDMELDK